MKWLLNSLVISIFGRNDVRRERSCQISVEIQIYERIVNEVITSRSKLMENTSVWYLSLQEKMYLLVFIPIVYILKTRTNYEIDYKTIKY